MTSSVTEHGHLRHQMAFVMLTALPGVRSRGCRSQAQLLIAFLKYWDGSNAGPKYLVRLKATAVILVLPGKTETERDPCLQLL